LPVKNARFSMICRKKSRARCPCHTISQLSRSSPPSGGPPMTRPEVYPGRCQTVKQDREGDGGMGVWGRVERCRYRASVQLYPPHSVGGILGNALISFY
jgi:hypothetical protein